MAIYGLPSLMASADILLCIKLRRTSWGAYC